MGTISDEWHKFLVNYATVDLENQNAYAIHPHFGNTTDKLFITDRYKNDDPVLHEFIRDKKAGLSQYFDNDYLTNITIQRVEPYSYIYEHTDNDGPYPMLASITHKIHIPLVTNRYVAFTWRRDGPPVVMSMQEKNIYLFNQVVTHNVINLSDYHRYHLIAQYTREGIPEELWKE